MNLRYPPFFSVYDFSQYSKWENLDDADKIRIITATIKRIHHTNKQDEFLTFQFNLVIKKATDFNW